MLRAEDRPACHGFERMHWRNESDHRPGERKLLLRREAAAKRNDRCVALLGAR
jgi:hypothetical protein